MPYLLDDAFNTTANYPPPPPERKRLIDKNAPIASLAAGNNQFTAISDTNHGNGNILNRLTNEIPELARAGVKHIMLEYPIYPLGHPFRTSDDERIEDILSRLNSHPSQITEHEIWRNAELFKSKHEKASSNETGEAHANLLISAMKAGINVHFAGDDKGAVEDIVKEKITQEENSYLKKHAKLERFYQRFLNEPDFLQNLNWPEKEKRALETRIFAHHDIRHQFFNRWNDANNRYEEERVGLGAELERADRFVKLANGEKSVVVFGRDHFNNKFDLNEAIDMTAKMDALKHGRPIPAKTPVVEIYVDQKGREAMIDLDTHEKDVQTIVDPALRIFADSGKIEIPESSQKDFAFKPITQTQPANGYNYTSP